MTQYSIIELSVWVSISKMKKWVLGLTIIVICLFATEAIGQTYTQTYKDKCTGEIKVATTTMTNGFATVSFYNQVRVFSPQEVMAGAVQLWITATYTAYSTMGCPTNQVVQQTVTNAVAQATSQAASTAASSAASSAASGAVTASTGSTPPPTTSSSGSATSGGSGSSSSSSTESKTETKTETKSESKEETKSESKSEEKQDESKSEESKEEKKEEKKKEEKKKSVANPMMLASDLAGTEDMDGRYSVMMSVGVSRSSLMGDKSYSATALIWSTMNQFALSAGVTKMDFEEGKLNAIHSYGTTFAYLRGTLMNLNGYTYIKPHPKYGTFGYNVGIITLMMPNMGSRGYSVSLSASAVGFWMKPYSYSRKVTLTPQLFVMQSPIAWNTMTGGTSVSRTPGAIVGLGWDYKISKRFGLSTSYRGAMNFEPNFNLMHNFQIGSKMVF
jgi:hypothetical protein